MPSKNGRGNHRGPKTIKKGSGKSFLRSLFSGPVILAFLFVVILCLCIIFWPQISAWFDRLGQDIHTALYSAWLATFRFLGLGVIFAALAFLSLFIIMGWPSSFVRHWHYWLGTAAFVAALWGLLAFFRPPNTFVVSEVTLGGYVGQAIITRSPVAGGFIVAGLVILGIILIAPEWTWNVVKRAFKCLAGFFGEIIYVIKESGRKKPVPETPVSDPPAAPAAVEQPEPIEHVATMDRLRSSITVGGWSLPNINILDKVAEAVISDAEIEKRKETLEEALTSYGVDAKVVEVNRGPTVTQFGVEPGWDRRYKEVREKDRDGNVNVRQEEVGRMRVKVERINSLANDLALALAAPSIRIEAPVPGKSMVGIEVPNTIFGSVGLRGVMESTGFQKMLAKSPLAIALGKGAGGETVVADLAKMPHLLIAGATGSGKSVCLNSVICCLMMNNTPDAVRFVMVDPKRVELVNYNNIPHLVAPVVVDTDKAIMALRWLNLEMDTRYKRFSATKCPQYRGLQQEPAAC